MDYGSLQTEEDFTPDNVFAFREWWSHDPANIITKKYSQHTLSMSRDNNNGETLLGISGITRVNGTGTQCLVYVFNKGMDMMDVILSENDGSYTINSVYVGNDHHLVCKSLTNECPQISGKLQPG